PSSPAPKGPAACWKSGSARRSSLLASSLPDRFQEKLAANGGPARSPLKASRRAAEVNRVAKLVSRLREQRFQSLSLGGVALLAGQVVQFAGIFGQVKELRVSHAAGVVLQELPAGVANHTLAVAIGPENIRTTGQPVVKNVRYERASFDRLRHFCSRKFADRGK